MYTFDSIKTLLKNKLSLLSSWKKTFYHGVYERIIDTVSYIVNRLVYVAEYYYREAHWKTAQNKESLVNLSPLLSYNPYRKKGSSGYIQLIADSTWEESSIYTYEGDNINISKWQQFSDDDKEILVYSTEAINYSTGQISSINIPVKEGEPKTYFYTAIGETSEIISLYSDSVDNDEIEVFMVDSDSNELSQVTICSTDDTDTPDSLFFADDTDNYYCEISNSNDFTYINITFGDGITAAKLVLGDYVLIKYADTNGADGDIQESDTITTISSTITDISGEEVQLYVTNSDEITGGEDEEELESIRSNGRSLFGAGYRAGGYTDWETILENHSAINKVVIWSTDDIADDTITTNQNKVFVSAVSSSGEELTTTEKDDIDINYMKDKKSPTEIISWQDLNVFYVRAVVTGKIDDTSTTTQVASEIKNSIYETYSILETEFKTNIYESDFYALVQANESIVRHVSELYNLEKELSYNEIGHTLINSVTSSTESDDTKQIYLYPDSLEIYVKMREQNTSGYADISYPTDLTGTTVPAIGSTGTIYSLNYNFDNIGASDITFTIDNTMDWDTICSTIQVAVRASTLLNEIIVINEGVIRSYSSTDGSSSSVVVTNGTTGAGGDFITEVDSVLLESATFDTPEAGTDRDYDTWEDAILAAHDDGGSLVEDNDYTLSSTSLNYTTNNVAFVITDLAVYDADEYDVILSYKTKDGTGAQYNSIRIGSFDTITDVDKDWLTINLTEDE